MSMLVPFKYDASSGIIGKSSLSLFLYPSCETVHSFGLLFLLLSFQNRRWVSAADGLQLRVVLQQDANSAQSACVYGIEVALASSNADIQRINSGGPTVVDAQGRTWRSDTAFAAGGNPGGQTVRPSSYITVLPRSNAVVQSYVSKVMGYSNIMQFALCTSSFKQEFIVYTFGTSEVVCSQSA